MHWGYRMSLLSNLAAHFPPSLAFILFFAVVLVFIARPGFSALSQPGLDAAGRRLVGTYFDKLLAMLLFLVALFLLVFLFTEPEHENPPSETPGPKAPALLIVRSVAG